MKPFRFVRAAALTLVVSAGLAVSPAARADDDKAIAAEVDAMLTVGDKAPALRVEKFVKGEPVKAFEKGSVYVVEFWATWCGPCVASMPHISELQHKFADKGVRIVGVNIWEEDKYSDATLAKVEKFVAEKGDKMAYTVAYDGAGKHTDEAFMKAAGRNGIPSAFVINQDGVVAWIGHPTQLDTVLDEVTGSRYDLASATTRSREAAANLVKGKLLNKKIVGFATAGDFDAINSALADLDDQARSEQVQRTFGVLIKDEATQPRAFAFADKMASGPCKDNAQALNMFAWAMVDPAGKVKNPDVAVALRIAQRASDLTDNKDGPILDTLARAYWLKGDKAKAIEIQEKAVANAEGDMKEELAKSLKEYKAAR